MRHALRSIGTRVFLVSGLFLVACCADVRAALPQEALAWARTLERGVTIGSVSVDARLDPDGRVVSLQPAPGACRLGSPSGAGAWLATHARALGLEGVDLGAATITKSPAGSVVLLSRRQGGRPVFDQQVRLLVDGEGDLRWLRSTITSASDASGEWNEAKAKQGALKAAAADGVSEPWVIAVTRHGWAGTPPRPVLEMVLGSRSETLVRIVYWTDGATGDVMRKHDLVRDLGPITGSVFNPNPIASLNRPDLIDASFIPGAAYFDGTIDANDPVGGVFALAGPYARVGDWMPPTVAPLTAVVSDGFRRVRTETGFTQYNAWFWTSLSSQYVDQLGFTLWNWPLLVDAECQDAGAFYAGVLPSPGGLEPALCFGLSLGAGLPVDTAEDADVVLHENMHGILDGLRGLDFAGNGEVGAIQEGSGDYWASAWGYQASIDAGFDPACFAEWSVAGGLPCLRTVNNGLVYPDDLQHPSQTDEHHDGKIWSQFLWDLAFRIGDFETVNVLFLQAALLVAPYPSMFEYADAMYAADQVLYGGTHLAEIQNAATARGLYPRPGEVSGPDSGLPLLIRKAATPDGYVITWENLVDAADAYHLYEGSISGLSGPSGYSHGAATGLCDAVTEVAGGGRLRTTFTTDRDDYYYLVTASLGAAEGPSGYSWLPGIGRIIERDPSANDCWP